MTHSFSELNAIALSLADSHWVDLEDFGSISLELCARGYRLSEYADEIVVIANLALARRSYARLVA